VSFADDVRALKNRALTELTAAHDYHADTITAWQLLEQAILSGQTFSVTNSVTGTVTTQVEIAGKIRGYIADQHAAMFQTFLVVFEAFFTDFLRAWLRAQPQYLMPTDPVDFPTIFHAADKGAIIDLVVERKVQGLFYKKPTEWFKYLDDKVQLGCPSVAEVGKLAEAKAARDVLVHNRGIVNEVYLSKSGTFARYVVGERITISEAYHREVWNLLQKIVADLADAMLAKFP
jgi:hypothetical protein